MAANSKTLDTKKSASTATAGSNGAGTAEQIVSFCGDVKTEFKKISWTTKEELILYTKIVVVSTFIFGFGIYLIDLAIQGALAVLSRLVMLIAG